MESKPFTSTLRVRHKLRRWMLDIYEDFYFQSTSHAYSEVFWSDNRNISLVQLIIDIFTAKLHISVLLLYYMCQSTSSLGPSLRIIRKSHATFHNLIILDLFIPFVLSSILHRVHTSFQSFMKILFQVFGVIYSTLTKLLEDNLMQCICLHSSCFHIKGIELCLLCRAGSCCDWMLCWWL